MRTRAFRLVAVLVAVTPVLIARAAGDAIDLTDPGSFVRGRTKATIIDTRSFHTQIAIDAPWQGDVRLVKNRLPAHVKPNLRRTGPPNELTAGINDLPGQMGPQTLFPAIQQTPWAPPDPTLAVGPDYIVETVNMAIAFYKKDGELIFSQYLDNTGDPGFFEDIGGGNFTFDPKCYYDHYSGRFFVLALEVYSPSESWVTFAVSDDSDPTGTWYKYRTDSVVRVGGDTFWVDYPGLGFDEVGMYVTGNLFGLNNGGWAGVFFRCFDKTPLLVGEDAVYNDLRDGNSASAQVAQCFGANQTPYFVSLASDTQVRVQAITDPFGAPALVTADVSVPKFAWPQGGAPTKGGGSIDVLDGRLINAHWRDGDLYCGHGVWSVGGSDPKAIARWYHFDTQDWPNSGKPVLVQSGAIVGGKGVYSWFPALYSNARGDVGIVVARSSAEAYPSVEVAGRKSSDPAGKMSAVTQLKVGAGPYSGRWGDYFDICVDPNNDHVFWVVGEYPNSDGGWGTYIGSFLVSKDVGDLNCDGAVDFNDIDPFVTALSSPTDYAKLYAGCEIMLGDINGDGSVDFNDIDAFVALLTK